MGRRKKKVTGPRFRSFFFVKLQSMHLVRAGAHGNVPHGPVRIVHGVGGHQLYSWGTGSYILGSFIRRNKWKGGWSYLVYRGRGPPCPGSPGSPGRTPTPGHLASYNDTVLSYKYDGGHLRDLCGGVVAAVQRDALHHHVVRAAVRQLPAATVVQGRKSFFPTFQVK